MVATLGQIIELEFSARSADWLGEFDRLEVWRSRLTEYGPYDPLTTDNWSVARLPIGISTTSTNATGSLLPLVGTSLDLLVNEAAPISVTFTGSDPLSVAEAASQIRAQSQGFLVTYVNLEGRLVIETVEPGQKAALRVLGGNAAPLLKLPSNFTVSFGSDPAITLIDGQDRYLFSDINGDASYFYKTRYLRTSDRRVGEFSRPFSGRVITKLSSDAVVLGTIDVVGTDGTAVANREILVYSRFQGKIVEGMSIVGGALRRRTNCDGHAEFLLPRGLSITVAIAGTNLVRDVEVPTDPVVTVFNLLDPTRGANDVFTVQYPQIDYAKRTAI